MNAKIVFHLYLDVAWPTAEAVSLRKSATEPAVVTHDRVVSELVTQAHAVVGMCFALALAEMRKDSVGWPYYYLGERPVGGTVTDLCRGAEDEDLSEWTQPVAGPYVHDVVAAMNALVVYSNQSAEPHLVTC